MSKVDNHILGWCIITSIFVFTYVPFKSVMTTLYELWTKCKYDLSILKPWGCAAYVHNSSYKHGKLGLKKKKYIFIRYFESSNGHMFIYE